MTTLLEMLQVPGGIRVEFQPMLLMAKDAPVLYALEALSRGPVGSSIERADVLFEYARRKGEEPQIDVLCIGAALTAAADLPGEPTISMNVHGSTLSDIDGFADLFLGMAESRGIAPNRLMIEIVEHRTPWVMANFDKSLAELREAGVRIAVDDLGIGASNLRMVVDCRPDHLKVDRYIVKGCSGDPVRATAIASMALLANSIGASAIAEGIENNDDLDMVISLGVQIVQGWLFAPAMPALDLAFTPYLVPQPIEKGLPR